MEISGNLHFKSTFEQIIVSLKFKEIMTLNVLLSQNGQKS